SVAQAATGASLAPDTLPRRSFLGVSAEPAPGNHIRIAKIVPGSSAARSELRVGDILLAVNGSPIESVATFLSGMKSFQSGDRLICRVLRDQKELNIEVSLGDWPREQPGDIQVLYDAFAAPEATVRSLVTRPGGKT